MSNHMNGKYKRVEALVFVVLLSTIAFAGNDKWHPKVGAKALDFTLRTLQKEKINLMKLVQDKPVVLVVLRGWPGYQCPICTRQVGELIKNSIEFKKRNVYVLMVYPGPNNYLQDHAEEFIGDKIFPKEFIFTLDPDYAMVNLYGLRWNKEKETAFPSTIVINEDGTIVFSKISTSHGGRPKIEDVLEVLDSI